MDLVWGVYGIRTPEKEFRFHPSRKYRFDFAFVDVRVAVEIEGGIWTHGAHARGKGIIRDMDKYNEAARLGWRVFRFTPKQLRTGEAQAYVKGVLDAVHG